MLIRRRTLRLAVHQKSTTMTVGNPPQTATPCLVTAQVPLADEALVLPPEPKLLSEPAPKSWLRRMLTSRRSRTPLLLALLWPSAIHAGSIGSRCQQASVVALR